MPLKNVFNSGCKHTINFEVTCRTYNLYQDELDYIGNDHLFDSKGILEKAMAPHSSTLAWKIPWTEEPGKLQSMGSLRVRHD